MHKGSLQERLAVREEPVQDSFKAEPEHQRERGSCWARSSSTSRAHIDSPECKLIKEREQVEIFREELARCRAAPR